MIKFHHTKHHQMFKIRVEEKIVDIVLHISLDWFSLWDLFFSSNPSGLLPYLIFKKLFFLKPRYKLTIIKKFLSLKCL